MAEPGEDPTQRVIRHEVASGIKKLSTCAPFFSLALVCLFVYIPFKVRRQLGILVLDNGAHQAQLLGYWIKGVEHAICVTMVKDRYK